MPAQLDVATFIASSIGSLTLGTNCFAGPVKKVSTGSGVPHTAVFVIGTGGLQKEAFIDGGSKGSLSKPTVQILVRSDKNDLSGGLTLAESIMAVVDMGPPTASYVESRSNSSDPIYIGTDETGHHEWSINLTLTK